MLETKIGAAMAAKEKWADFIITKKRMNAKGTHIDRVLVQSDLGPLTVTRNAMLREEVVANLKKGVTYITAYTGTEGGGLKKGALVIIDPVDGIDYIKTVADKSKRDNLDNLPDF